jgi:hypothetical protein
MSNKQIPLAGSLVADAGRPAFQAAPASSALPTRWSQADQAADAAAVRQLFQRPGLAVEPELAGTGFTYRHDWGARRGQWVLRLNWSALTPQSRVLVAIAEGAGGGVDSGKFIGAARYTLHSVAPRAGGVDIWVDIEWSADISLYVDYLVVNP